MTGSLAAVERANPFPGLRPFREDEEHLFFGRERQVDALITKLSRTHLLSVVGTSGSGKSSLVNCGLRPALHRGLMADAGCAWKIAQFRPGRRPLESLAHAIVAAGILRPVAGTDVAMEDVVATHLRVTHRGLLNVVRKAQLPSRTNVLFVADQFEEIFRFRQSGETVEEATAFVNLLLTAAQAQDRIHIVLTMRSDFLGDCVRFHGLPEAMDEGQFLVPRMTRDERRSAIAGPVAVASGELDPALLTQLVNDVGDNPDQLSILQHALNRIWAHWESQNTSRPMTLDDYEAIGTMAHALDWHAEKAYAEVDAKGLAPVCEKMFKALTDKSTDARGIRRPAEFVELCAIAEVEEDRMAHVISAFRKPSRSFVMPPEPESLRAATVIDISHESLMRIWQRLKDWADEEADSSEWYRRVEDRSRAVEGAYLADPELEAALKAKEKGRWNKAWAERYRTQKRGVRPEYDDVIRFLDGSRTRVRDNLRRVRRELSDLKFIQDKCAAGEIDRLVAEYDTVLQSAGVGDDKRAQLAGFARFIRAQRDLLATHPELTLQQAFNLPNSTAPAAAARKVSKYDVRPMFRWVNKPQTPSPCVLTLSGHKNYVNACDVAPNADRIVSASSDEKLKIWDAATGKEISTLTGHNSSVETCSYSPDGRQILAGGRDGKVKIWNAVTGEEIRPLTGHERPILIARFSPDGKRAITASQDGTMRLWDADTGGELLVLHSRAGLVSCCDFSPDGKSIVSGGADGWLTLWNNSTGEQLFRFEGHERSITCAVFSADGESVFSASEDGTLKRWNAATGELKKTFEGHEGTVWALAVSPDCSRLASVGQDRRLIFWDVERGEALASVTGHRDDVRTIAFFGDGSRVVSGSWDMTLKVWSLDAAEQIDSEQRAPVEGEYGGPQVYMICSCCSRDGAWHAAGSSDGSLRLWDALTGLASGVFPLHRDLVMACAFSPDSKWIISGSWDGSVSLFDVSVRRELAAFALPEMVCSCAFSHDGKRMFACSGSVIRVWDVQGSEVRERCSWQAGAESFVSCAISPGGEWVVAALESGTFVVWDVLTERPLRSFAGTSGIACCTLSPDGRRLAAASDPSTVRIRDVESGEQMLDLAGHTLRVVSCNFSPDGSRLVTGSYDQTVRIWDLESPDHVIVLHGHTGQIQDACFTSDGKQIVSTAVDGSVRCWDATTGRWLGSLLSPADSAFLCAFSPDRPYVLTASHYDRLKLWDSVTGRLERVVSGHQDTIRSCSFSANGQFVTASADGTLKLWSVESSEPLLTLTGHNGPVQSCAFSPDGTWIVSGGTDKTVRIWNVLTGEQSALAGHDDWVQVVLVAAGGSRIVSCSHDKTVVIWDASTGGRVHTLRGHADAINTAALSPDGLRVVTGSEDGKLNVWDVETGAQILQLEGHTAAIRDCAYARKILSASNDGELWLWQTEPERNPIKLGGHTGTLFACRFSPDGRHALSGGADQFVRLWDTENGALLGEYWAGAPVQSVAWQTGSRRIAVGDNAGKLHLLELEGALPADARTAPDE